MKEDSSEITKAEFVELFNKRDKALDLTYPESPEKDRLLDEHLFKVRRAMLHLKIEERVTVKKQGERSRARGDKETKEFKEKSKNFPVNRATERAKKLTRLEKAQADLLKIGMTQEQFDKLMGNVKRDS